MDRLYCSLWNDIGVNHRHRIFALERARRKCTMTVPSQGGSRMSGSFRHGCFQQVAQGEKSAGLEGRCNSLEIALLLIMLG